ncbi:MAG TPA: tetratricopeptide repeat protein [Stellaceae bacterium]|nr:tetratricopeptide repeat protein [Stellaceae bacterium]
MMEEKQDLPDWVIRAWRAFVYLRNRFGVSAAVIVAVLAVAAVVWWQWDEIAKKPGVSAVVAWIMRTPLPSVEQGRLAIAIAHLDHDEREEHERLLRDELADFEGARILRLDRTIELPNAPTEQDAKALAEENARELLRRVGADVLIWGSVVSLNGKSAMRLYWTTAETLAGAKQSERYPVETVALPPLFWDDLKQVLGMLAQSRIATLTAALTGHYMADKLASLIADVRKLLQNKQGAAWNAETEAGVRFALARALLESGEQAGDSALLAEAADDYRRVLGTWTRERVPLQWAATQNNLGTALWTLGERESGTARLEQAVDAYSEALKELTRERVPLDWAMTQNNLGNALSTLGERESGKARLEQAVAAYDAALSVFIPAGSSHYIDVARGNREQAARLLAERRGTR